MEYLWSGGEAMSTERSPDLRAWVGRQAQRLRRGATANVLAELRRMRAEVPTTGPGTKGRRQRLDQTISH